MTNDPTKAPEPAVEVEAALITVRDWLRYATSRFGASGLVFGHGTDSALDEAAFLILHTLSLPIDQLDPWLDARLTPQERSQINTIIERRISTRKPAPYLTGVAYIQGRRFVVDERVIVPRSYIGELLASGTLETFLASAPSRVLDLCTGSGCLAILAQQSFSDAVIDASDVSRDALEVARRNVSDYGLQDRIALFCGDLFAPLGEHKYDLIIANPPYVAGAEVAAFPPEYAAEPALAHIGGEDGLDIVRRIIAEAADHLTPQGILVMEIGTARAMIEAAYPDLEPVWLDTAASEGEVMLLSAADLGSIARY
jgi:ribosomal protein L3 glutamine methyltransferase